MAPCLPAASYVLVGARGKRQCADAAKAFTIENFSRHDLRRTASTKMREAGVPSADVSKVLNHVERGPKATRVYDRYDNDREKQVALDTGARQLTSILEQQTTGAQVVAFARN